MGLLCNPPSCGPVVRFLETNVTESERSNKFVASGSSLRYIWARVVERVRQQGRIRVYGGISIWRRIADRLRQDVFAKAQIGLVISLSSTIDNAIHSVVGLVTLTGLTAHILNRVYFVWCERTELRSIGSTLSPLCLKAGIHEIIIIFSIPPLIRFCACREFFV